MPMAHRLAAQESHDRQACGRAPRRQRPARLGRRRRYRRLVVALVVCAVVIVASTNLRRDGAVPKALVSGSTAPESGVWLGVQVGSGSTGSTQQTLGDLETRMGRRLNVVYQQLRWDEPLGRVPALEAGRHPFTPLLGWKLKRSDGSIVPWPSIAAGKEDVRLTAMATRLKALPRPVFLAFAHQPEPEVGSGFGGAGDYALAYRHAHDLFAKLGVTNVVWVWSMTGASRWTDLHTRLYPGDAYVDWIAFDVGDSQCRPGATSRSLAAVTAPSHRWASTQHPDKPAMVTGYRHVDGPAAARLEADEIAADVSVLTSRRPGIKALVYAGASGRAICGRGMASSSMAPTPLSDTRQAGGGGSLATVASARVCLSRDPAKVTRVDGTLPTYRMGSVTDGRTYDLRGATIVGYPNVNRYALLFGKHGAGNATCVVGGRIVGQQSRALSWHTMKGLDGDGLNFRSQGGIVDGIRVDNLEDGISTIGGDPAGVTIRNAHLTYIRDDCIENDAIVAMRVEDSLLDGCFNGISERPGRNGSPPPPSPGEELALDGVLLRVRPMPYDRPRALCGQYAADGLGGGAFFKWSRQANRLVVRNTVLLAERGSVNCGASMSFPGDGVYENVTLVWLGEGTYPGRLPPSGVTVTRDRRVWDEARARWLARHGYAASDARP
jgi:hypothetical protein